MTRSIWRQYVEGFGFSPIHHDRYLVPDQRHRATAADDVKWEMIANQSLCNFFLLTNWIFLEHCDRLISAILGPWFFHSLIMKWMLSLLRKLIVESFTILGLWFYYESVAILIWKCPTKIFRQILFINSPCRVCLPNQFQNPIDNLDVNSCLSANLFFGLSEFSVVSVVVVEKQPNRIFPPSFDHTESSPYWIYYLSSVVWE